jgi:DNA-binding NarL/FixJ family response regulator
MSLGEKVRSEPLHQIKVAIYGGDPLSRAGLNGYLERQEHIAVLREFDAESETAAGDVAVMVVDELDPNAAGRLRKLVLGMEQRLVLVTGELDEEHLMLALDAGVHTIVWRHQATADRLVKAVEAAAQGDSEVPSDLLKRLLSHITRMRGVGRAPQKPRTGLSEREVGVLQLVAKGLDTKEIAGQLSYSERTVKGTLHDIMARTQLRNRAHAVAFAIREGYI